MIEEAKEAFEKWYSEGESCKKMTARMLERDRHSNYILMQTRTDANAFIAGYLIAKRGFKP